MATSHGLKSDLEIEKSDKQIPKGPDTASVHKTQKQLDRTKQQASKQTAPPAHSQIHIQKHTNLK